MKSVRSLSHQGGWIAAAIAVGSAVIGGIGASKSAKASKRAAAQARERGKDQNAYNKMTARAVEASGQREAFDIKRQAKIMASRAVAVSAAGGYTEDITNLIADIDGEGNYRASIALFNAADEAEGLRFEGDQAEKYGADQSSAYRARAKATQLSGAATVLSGIGKAWGLRNG